MEQSWLECSIDTTAAGIEPVCAYLTACGIAGLEVEEEADFLQFADENRDSWDEVDEALARERQGCNRVKYYLPEDEEGRAQLSALSGGLPALRARTACDLGALTVTVRSLREEDWANNWKQYYTPFSVGGRLYVVPEWLRDQPVPMGRQALYLNPGLIFGTGSHGTTRLCLEALERYVKPGDRMLDLGCGSGILAIAARKLGAKSARGCDIDRKAVDVAWENAGYNGITEGFEVYCGDVLTDGTLQEALAGQYEVVAANIIADVIIPLSARVGAYLAPGGVFLCSGIIEDRAKDVERALKKNGFQVLQRWERAGWVAYATRRRE